MFSSRFENKLCFKSKSQQFEMRIVENISTELTKICANYYDMKQCDNVCILLIYTQTHSQIYIL